MIIGIDLTSLQGPHRFRGVGSVVRGFLNNLNHANHNNYVFYVLKKAAISSGQIINELDLINVKYEIRYIDQSRKLHTKNTSKSRVGIGFYNLPFFGILLGTFAKLKNLAKIVNKSLRILKLIVFKTYTKNYGNVSDLDAFIQFDQNMPLANLHGKAKNILICYDLIPYILEKDYLVSYSTARYNGNKILESIVKQLDRIAYIQKLRANTKRADKLIAISESTLRDFVSILNVDPLKIRLVNLGIDEESEGKLSKTHAYESTAWGYIKKPITLKKDKYILFMGGVDKRRKIPDLITAFNHLKAEGSDLNLVLAGDIMLGPEAITTESTRRSLSDSSYLKDIIFLGYVDQSTRDHLYKRALAFVFPSIYEGVGLPVLEAMKFGAPVIAYGNKAVKEVARNNILYCKDATSIYDSIKKIQNMPKLVKESMISDAKEYTRKFTWKRTCLDMLNYINE